MHARLAGLLALLGGAMAQACDGPLACGDRVSVSSEPEAPAIGSTDVVTQLAQDTWTVVLGVDFSDPDGDLSRGRVVFYLNDDSSTATSQALLPVFHQSALADDATTGTILVPLRFEDSIRDGTGVHLGLQLIDQAQHRSNCYGLALAFEVTPR